MDNLFFLPSTIIPDGESIVKHSVILLLVVGGILVFFAGCISTNSQDNLTAGAYPLPTTAAANNVVVPTICPVPGNTSPWIQVDPVALNHSTGEPLELSGTTNIKTGEKLRVYIVPPYRFGMVRTNVEQKCDTRDGVTSIIQRGNCSTNTWSFSDSNLTGTLSPSCPSYTIIITDINNTINGGEDEIRIVSTTDL